MSVAPQLATQDDNRWRLAALAVAIGLIVLLPYFFAQRSVDEALLASERVAHTAQVKAETTELLYLVRDVESAAFAIASGVRRPLFQERVDENLAGIELQLGKLKVLVADNPEQLVRIGRFDTVAAGRRRATELALLEVQTGRSAEALEVLAAAADEFRVRDLANEIIGAEESLLAERSALAAAKRRSAEWLGILAAVAQLVLLGAVLWIAERHLRRQRAAEAAERSAVMRTQAIFQAVREPIVLLDRQQHVLMQNHAFGQMYGPAPHSGAPRTLGEIADGAWNDPVFMQRLADVATLERELWDHELRQRSADGIERTLLVNARGIRLPDMDERAVLMTVADVSAAKRAEQQVRELNRQLEGKVEQVSETNRELEAFSYSVSHDLRAPLRHIAGFADKLDRHLGEGVDEKARHYLEVIGGSAKRMAGLIDDLLVYSRLGRHALRLQPVDMQSLVEETRDMLSADLGQRVVEWRIQPLPIVVADENMMRQIWQNLLGNAVKYSARRERAVIEVTHRAQGDAEHIEFAVRDNGAGFDMAYAGKLFGVFQRLHKASEFAGSGIGLANVRRIVARHGGRVWAEAQPDQGATFYFTLPTHPDPDAAKTT
jgi:PAS domain S-box-containing protein